MAKKGINYYFLLGAIALLAFGILFLANLSAPQSLQVFGNTNYYLFHQLYALIIGLVLGVIALKTPLWLIKKASIFLFLANLILIVAVFLPFLGVKFWGAQRWIGIGGNSLQPSEFLKVTAILYLASWMSNKFQESSKKGLGIKIKSIWENFLKIFLPFLVLLGTLSVLLLLQRDLSTLGIITAALMAVYFVAGTPLWHIILALGIEGGAALLLIRIEPYRLQRLLTFLNPESDPLGRGFQLKQSLLAIGSGGIFGRGWGLSTQKFGFLPQSMSDSVFAVLGEELGLIGCTILILLFVYLFWQGIRIAKNSTDKFAGMLSVGIMTWFIVQAFMNIASSLGVWPLAGIPLPFFSYGGSHLIAELIGIGLLLNISKHG